MPLQRCVKSFRRMTVILNLLKAVRDVCSVIDVYMHTIDNGSFNVDNLVEICNGIVYRAAENSCNVISLVISNVDGVARKPWFNNECKMFRKEYHRSKKYNRRQKTAERKLNLVRASRDYKKAIS